MLDSLPTPALVIDASTLHRNVKRIAAYAREHRLALRPHTKTHKSLRLARIQLESGAVGLTVAKVGEAQVMAETGADLLLAYPVVDRARATNVANLARVVTMRVAIDSEASAKALSAAAQAANSRVGVLVDIDTGLHRTGVQTPAAACTLAQMVARLPGLCLDGIFFYPGHIGGPASNAEQRSKSFAAVEALLGETIALWRRSGLEARIVSGGSTPSLLDSHRMPSATEIRPGTYVFNDMNCVHSGCATVEDCAAKILCTVVSDAVPGQVVIDAGSKTLTSDRCGPAPDSGHGLVLEYPQARIVKLTEEHGQIDISQCKRAPSVGERVSVIPNHICPCVNLQDHVWWQQEDGTLQQFPVDARGKLV